MQLRVVLVLCFQLMGEIAGVDRGWDRDYVDGEGPMLAAECEEMRWLIIRRNMRQSLRFG